MKISGIQPFSLLDFPGELACVIFTLGCNLRCSFCYNSEFVLPEKVQQFEKKCIPESVFFHFLEERREKLTGVSICGGEPTLWKDLPEFCQKVKHLGYKVKLDTNGSAPECLKELIEKGLIDYIAMDLKHSFGKISGLVGKQIDESLYLQSIRLLLQGSIAYEFRTTVIKGIHDEESIESICQSISGADSYYLQNYRPGDNLDPEFRGESFSREKLENFQKISTKYVKFVGIRN